VADEGRVLAVVNKEQVEGFIAGRQSDGNGDGAFAEALAEHGQAVVAVRNDATLREALDAMNRASVDLAVITGSSRRESGSVYGILTRAQIHAAVRYGG